MIYKKLKILFNKNQLLKLYGILLGSILAAFFEVVGIGSIPVFAMLIIDIESRFIQEIRGRNWEANLISNAWKHSIN